MSTVTITRQGTDVMVPRVNLLPPEIAEAEKFKRLQFVLGAVVFGAVGAVGVATVLSASQVSAAQTTYDAATAHGAQLQTEVAALADVPKVYAQVANAQAQLTSAMGEEVKWSYYLNDLGLTIPKNVAIDTMTVKQTIGGGVVSPVGTQTIAQVSFEGHAKTHTDVANFLESLTSATGYVDPYFTDSTEQTDASDTPATVKFSATVNVTTDAQSGDYTEQGK